MSNARNGKVAWVLLLALAACLGVAVGLLAQVPPPGGFNGLESATDLGVGNGYVGPGSNQITQAVQLTDSDDDAYDIIVKTVTIDNLGMSGVGDFASIEILDGAGTILGVVNNPVAFPVTIDIDDLRMVDPGTTPVSATLQVRVTVAAGATGHGTIQTRLTAGHTESDLLTGTPFHISADDSNATTINNYPVAVVDSYTVDEGGTINATVGGTPAGVLDNDTDADAGDVLTTTLFTGPSHAGSFTLTPDGSFDYTHDGSETTADSFVYEADDGHGGRNQATVAITITPQNDPPVVTAGGTLNYTEGDAASVIDSTITVVDSDDTNLENATVTIGPGYVNGEDVLGYTSGTIIGAWNAGTGVLTLTGTDTVADYQAALRSVTYNNTGGNTPTAGTRTITWVANDGTADSMVVTSTVNVTAKNDPPVITGQVALSTPEETALTIELANLTVTDPDDTYPDDFTLAVQDGTNYSRTGNTITPDTGFTGTLTVPVTVNDGEDDSNIFNLDVTVEAATAKTLGPGWHMISVPRTGGDTTPEAVFHDVIDSGQLLYLYEWVPESSYHTPTEVDPGKGYWLYLSAPVTVSVNGTSPTGDYSVMLDLQGWHQVSTPRWRVPWAAVQFTYGGDTKVYADAVSAGWLSSFVFWYDEAAGTYQVANLAGGIDPWSAYWMRTYVDNLVMILPLDQAYAPGALGTRATLDLKTCSQAMTSPPQRPSVPVATVDTLRFTNTPNPIRDIHTTTFAVKGLLSSMVQAIKVEIFDQSGRLVYASGEVPGTSLDWHTESEYGERLSNGVYLYRMYALVNGKWVVSDVKKLAIVR